MSLRPGRAPAGHCCTSSKAVWRKESAHWGGAGRWLLAAGCGRRVPRTALSADELSWWAPPRAFQTVRPPLRGPSRRASKVQCWSAGKAMLQARRLRRQRSWLRRLCAKAAGSWCCSCTNQVRICAALAALPRPSAQACTCVCKRCSAAWARRGVTRPPSAASAGLGAVGRGSGLASAVLSSACNMAEAKSEPGWRGRGWPCRLRLSRVQPGPSSWAWAARSAASSARWLAPPKAPPLRPHKLFRPATRSCCCRLCTW